MNKKEIRNAINKAAYQYAQSLGYAVSDDNDGSCVTFHKDGANVDDMIDWSRSSHYTCVLNWASEQTKADAECIDAHMEPIIKHYNDLYNQK